MSKRRFSSYSSTRKKYCMDVVGGLQTDKTPIIVYPCHIGTNQYFKYDKKTKQIKSKRTNKCLDIDKKGIIIQKKCNRNKTQKWKYKNKHWISLKNKKCIDVAGGDYAHGTLITYPCHKGTNQRFV